MNLARVLVEYGGSGFTHEGGKNITRIGDVGDDFILALDDYQEGMGVEYSLEHDDSMEVQIVELMHAWLRRRKT